MHPQIRTIIENVFSDLLEASEVMEESLDAEGLADCVGDRMADDSPEYRAMPYAERRALVIRVCKEYI